MARKKSPLTAVKPYHYLTATGKIPYNMTNDYIFRIVLQENPVALKGLVCALLYRKKNEIRSIQILNPIFPGNSVKDKEFRMDLRVQLPDRLLNLEMQVENRSNMPSRSLAYLSREFDHLEHGQDYNEATAVHQITFMNYTLFHDHPAFYATYRMMDVRDHYLYSDKFTISVVELGHIDLATKEDRHYKIDRWVRLFTAETWEELKMIAHANPAMESAAESLFLSNEEYNVRKVALERAEALLERQRDKEQIAKLSKENNEQASTIDEQASTIDEQAARIAELEAQLAAKNGHREQN